MCQTYHPERSSKRDMFPLIFGVFVYPIAVVLVALLIIAALSNPVFGATKRSACKVACADTLVACGFEAKPRKCRKVALSLCHKKGITICAVETTTSTTSTSTSTTFPDVWYTTTSLAPGQTTTTTVYTKALCRADCDGDYPLCLDDVSECYADCADAPYKGCRAECLSFETLMGKSCEDDLDVCYQDCAEQP